MTRTQPDMADADAILEFWFGNARSNREVAAQQSRLWWAKDAQVDAAMRRRFASAVEQAAAGRLDHWLAAPRTCLALILLTDQFPRNIYRDTPQAFACDGLANACCKRGLAQGFDQALRPIERVFFYLPLEHAESLEDQQQAVQRFEELADAVPLDERELFAGFVDFAVRHHHIVARFGRFPHRNAILGRSSTPEEIEFLKEKGSSF